MATEENFAPTSTVFGKDGGSIFVILRGLAYSVFLLHDR